MADTSTITAPPMTPLQAQCMSLHEYHSELIAAGFTPPEAMAYLIGITRRNDGN